MSRKVTAENNSETIELNCGEVDCIGPNARTDEGSLPLRSSTDVREERDQKAISSVGNVPWSIGKALVQSLCTCVNFAEGCFALDNAMCTYTNVPIYEELHYIDRPTDLPTSRTNSVPKKCRV